MSREADAHDVELASIAVERANDVMAACLLNIFGSKSRTEQNRELSELIEKCKIKGGQYARAVSLGEVDVNDLQSEPDIVKLAFVWKKITDLSSSKKAPTEDNARVFELIEELSGEYRQFAIT